MRLCAQRRSGGLDRLGRGFAALAFAGDDHLVIEKIRAIGVAEQQVGAMDVAGIDRRHEERRDPGVEVRVELDLRAARLFRALEARRQRVGVAQQRGHGGIAPGRRHRRLEAGEGAAGTLALHAAGPDI